jgi:hypothetical protein
MADSAAALCRSIKGAAEYAMRGWNAPNRRASGIVRRPKGNHQSSSSQFAAPAKGYFNKFLDHLACIHTGDPAIKSIRLFDEKWIQYLVVKEALRDKNAPRVETEVEGPRDFVFRKLNGIETLAAFELKGPFGIQPGMPGPKYLREIMDDFKKLSHCESLAPVPKYVVLLPWGNKSDVESCLQRLVPQIDHYPVTAQGLRFSTSEIHLNRIDQKGQTMLITLFGVASAHIPEDRVL